MFRPRQKFVQEIHKETFHSLKTSNFIMGTSVVLIANGVEGVNSNCRNFDFETLNELTTHAARFDNNF